jgi:hypothetical protein
VNGAGNTLYVRDAGFNTGSAQVMAQAHPTESSRRWKKNITDWPMRAGGAAVERAIDKIDRLRPVTFERADYDDWELPTGRRLQALKRLNDFNDHRDLEHFTGYPAHDCEIHDCIGDKDNPCVRVLNTKGTKYGMIAEEVVEVFPEAVHLDKDRQPDGIDYAMITTVLVAAVKELKEELAELKGER